MFSQKQIREGEVFIANHLADPNNGINTIYAKSIHLKDGKITMDGSTPKVGSAGTGNGNIGVYTALFGVNVCSVGAVGVENFLAGVVVGNAGVGNGNVILGTNIGGGTEIGDSNVHVGNGAGGTFVGDFNTLIGAYAGLGVYTGRDNTWIGVHTGQPDGLIEGTFIVAGGNSNTDNNYTPRQPLLIGSFYTANKYLRVNGKLSVGAKSDSGNGSDLFAFPEVAGTTGQALRLAANGVDLEWYTPA